MSNLVRNYQIFKTTSEHLHQICKPVTFPLSPETLDNISYLKTCFRKQLSTRIVMGLSAPQVGLCQRYFIMPRSFNFLQHQQSPSAMRSRTRNFEVFINPVVKKVEGEPEDYVESCLSVEKDYRVARPKKIEVQYQNTSGEVIGAKMEGLIALIFQHQLDHLNGITIEDIGKQEPDHPAIPVANPETETTSQTSQTLNPPI